jgi:hypothetical protein
MHMLGVRGMPRRIYTYPVETGWGTLNFLASVGVLFMAAGIVTFLLNVRHSRVWGVVAGDNPWGAAGLEWATSSPPPHCNFFDLPTVAGRDPLWDNPPNQPVVVGLREDRREVLITYVLDAEPDHREDFPTPSIWPFLTAITTSGLFIGSIYSPWAVPIGSIPVAVTLTGWFWPRKPDEGGTQPWPIEHRTLPLPNEASAPGGAA